MRLRFQICKKPWLKQSKSRVISSGDKCMTSHDLKPFLFLWNSLGNDDYVSSERLGSGLHLLPLVYFELRPDLHHYYVVRISE